MLIWGSIVKEQMMNHRTYKFKHLLGITVLFLVMAIVACNTRVSAAVSCKSVISYPGTTKSKVNMRKKAGTKYKALGMIEKGQDVIILGYVKSGGLTWYKCKATLENGTRKTGYISSLYIKNYRPQCFFMSIKNSQRRIAFIPYLM